MKLFLGKLAPDDSYKCVGYRRNLDEICDDAECTEINAPDILDFIEYSKHKEFILHLIKKLRHGGVLIIGGTDITTLSLNVFSKNLSVADANQLVFGSDDSPVKVALTNLEEVRKVILETELRITKQICEPNFLLGAKRL
jgi:hypothetical protein